VSDVEIPPARGARRRARRLARQSPGCSIAVIDRAGYTHYLARYEERGRYSGLSAWIIGDAAGGDGLRADWSFAR
jgi:hypothetical protein